MPAHGSWRWPNSPANGKLGRTLEGPERTASGDRRRDARAVGRVRIHAVSGAARRMAAEERDEAFPERIQAYALKAAREGKQETSWLNPNQTYEAGCGPSSNGFWIARSRLNSQFDRGACKTRRAAGGAEFAGPDHLEGDDAGVPDFYQGTEFWDLSLVDPDNRRPVDFAGRAAALAALENPDWADLARHWPTAISNWPGPASAEAADRTRRIVRATAIISRLSQRPASRPCHRLRKTPRPQRRDRRGREIARRFLARRPGMATRRGL